MRYFIVGLIGALCLVCGASVASARMGTVPPGTVRSVLSDNGRYALAATYGDQGVVTLTMTEDGNVLWTDMLLGHPGAIAIADDGAGVFVMTTWGWMDEGGADGIAVYDQKGEVARKIPFGTDEASSGALKWVSALAISPDGQYVAVGEDTLEQGRVTLYDAHSGEIVWVRTGGLEDVAQVRVASGGAYVLSATHAKEGQDMAFVLFDRSGEAVWQKDIPKNYSWDVPRYAGFDGDGGLEVFDLQSGVFLKEKLPR